MKKKRENHKIQGMNNIKPISSILGCEIKMQLANGYGIGQGCFVKIYVNSIQIELNPILK